MSVYFCMYEYAVDLSHCMLTFEQITILNLVAAIETNNCVFSINSHFCVWLNVFAF